MERRSRIPRPAARAALRPIPTSVADAPSNRKRRASPVSKDVQPATKKAISAPQAAVSSSEKDASKEFERAEWEALAEEMGWTPLDCLQHKITFTKRADAKTKIDTLATHMKHLRLAGWMLQTELESLQTQIGELSSQLKTEQAQRVEDRISAEKATEHAVVRAAELGERLQKADKEARTVQAQLPILQRRVEEMEAALQTARTEAETARTEAQRTRAELSSVSAALATATAQAAEGQRYAAELQGYNATIQSELATCRAEVAGLIREKAALAEEAGRLRGSVRGLEAQLATLEASASGREASSAADAAEAARLRAELELSTRERASVQVERTVLQEKLTTLQSDLDRYKAVAGADLAAAEAAKHREAEAEEKGRARAALAAGLADSLALAREETALATARCETAEAEARRLRDEIGTLRDALADAERAVVHGETIRRKLHNTIQELKGNIRVFCRVRPTGGVDDDDNCNNNVAVTADASEGTEVHVRHSTNNGNAAPAEHNFTFDRVFGPQATQDQVFTEISQLVQSALDGYNICIFAYGQTGSGKTYTMLGTEEHPGMIPRTMRQLFNDAAALEQQGWQFKISGSVVEIYNEAFKDLLGPSGGLPDGKKHTVVQDPKTGQTSISFVKVHELAGPEDVDKILDRAMKLRAVGATAMNDQSSRSHMVFILSISGINEELGQSVQGCLNLVDLAGSERLSKSGAEGKGLKETQAINKSLSALGDVIAALMTNERHIPFRNSKLTHLLQGSLTAASGKALMFVHVAPEPSSSQETLCTLRFGAKVAGVDLGGAKRHVRGLPMEQKS